MRNEAGNPTYSAADITALTAWPPESLEWVASAILRLNRVG